MANTDKDILITPNVGEVEEPKIEFKGFDNNPITLKVLDDNSITFLGSLGQILTLDRNVTSGTTFSANDISGIPIIATDANGTAQLTPYGGNTVVGGTSGNARLNIQQDTANPNAPVLAFPDSANPRYSAGFSSQYITGIGQRLDFYVGDSGSNTANIGSSALKMSLRADGRLGLGTTVPNSPFDIVTINYANNQAEIGPELRTPSGEYRWRLTTNTDANRWYLKLKVPSDTSGNTQDWFLLRSRTDKIGPEALYMYMYGANVDDSTQTLRNILYADSYRIGINRNSSFDGQAKLHVGGHVRIQDRLSIGDAGVSTAWNFRMEDQIDFNNSGWGLKLLYGYFNNRQMHTWPTNYMGQEIGIYRSWPRYFETTSGSTQGGRPRYTYNIVSVVRAQGVNTGDSRLLVNNVIHQYGPIGTNTLDDGYVITNINIPNYTRSVQTDPETGIPTGVLNNTTVTCTLTIETTSANSVTGAVEGHKFHYNQGLIIDGTGLTECNRVQNCFRPNSSPTNPYPNTIQIQFVNPGWETYGGTWDGSSTSVSFGGTRNHVPSASTARLRGYRINIGMFNTGTGANTALDPGWNDRWTAYFLPGDDDTRLHPFTTTTAANPAVNSNNERGKALYIDTLLSASYDISNTGQVSTYGDFSNSWQNYPALHYIGNGDQQEAFLDSHYANLNYSYFRAGNVNKSNYANAYLGYGECVRGLAYNLYGGRYVNPRTVFSYNRNYRNGRMDNPFNFNADFYNGLNATTGAVGYVADTRGLYSYMETRYGSRTNSKFGHYHYLRCGIDRDERLRGTTVNNMYGGYHYLRVDGGTVSNAFGLQIVYDIRGITFNTTELTSDGTLTPSVVSNRWGVYCVREDRNYFSGRVGIGTTPATGINLDVTGEMRCPTITTNTIKFRQTSYGTNSDPYGFRFVTPSSNNSVLELHLNDDSNEEFAIYGYSCSGYGCGEWSGNKYHYFRSNGDAFHSGTLTKGSGTFRIPHPLPELTETKDLVHSFVEGPRPDLIYRNKVQLVDGRAVVDIDVSVGMTPGTWGYLCRDPQVFVTNNEGWTPVRATVTDTGIITIEAQDASCTDTIDWMVIAERQDAKIKEANWTDDDGRTILEPDKMKPDYETYEDFLAAGEMNSTFPEQNPPE